MSSEGTARYVAVPWPAPGNSTHPHYSLFPIQCLNTADVKAPEEPAPGTSEEAIKRLHTIVETIRSAHPLAPTSLEIDDLLARAIQLQGLPANIDSWANQLAGDVGDLTD